MHIDKLPIIRKAVILDIRTSCERAGRYLCNECESRAKIAMPLGSLYTTLTLTETSVFVESRIGDTKLERRGYPRKFFSITGTGERALNSYQTFIANAF